MILLGFAHQGGEHPLLLVIGVHHHQLDLASLHLLGLRRHVLMPAQVVHPLVHLALLEPRRAECLALALVLEPA